MLSTLYELSVSAKDSVLEGRTPFEGMEGFPLGAAESGFGGAIVLTRSAQDLGAAFAVEIEGSVCSTGTEPSSLF